LIGKIGGLVPAFANAALRSSVIRRVIGALLGIHSEAPLPKLRGKAFRRWFRNQVQPNGPELLFFPGCSIDGFDPETGMWVVKLLNALGYKVRLSVRSCCSLPMLSSGEWRPARHRARRLIDDLADDLKPGEMLITSSTSCGLTLKSKYADYLGMDDANTRRVSSSVRDICEFIRELGSGSAHTHFKSAKPRIFYHAPCQLRGHSIGIPALELLSHIPGIEIIHSEADCCGIGGTYGYNTARHQISDAIAAPLKQQIFDTAPDLLVCDSETCRWHLEGLTGIRATHPVEVLAVSKGL
jgi:glycerol-3-phosphate dehydrogenase subunit C